MLKFRQVNIAFLLFLVPMLISDRWVNVPVICYAIIIGLYLAVLAYGSTVLSASFFVPVNWRGDPASNTVALTFDDGPIKGRTDLILNVLKKYNVPAAFFCIGKHIDGNITLVQTIHKEGHLVCNHSYWHRYTFDLQSGNAIAKELEATDQSIQRSIGYRPAFFRPPYGVTNPMVARAINKGQYKTIGWTVRSFDTSIKDGTRLMERITRSLKGGDIILLHDHGAATLQILPGLIEHIGTVGLKIVRVDKLLNESPYV